MVISQAQSTGDRDLRSPHPRFPDVKGLWTMLRTRQPRWTSMIWSAAALAALIWAPSARAAPILFDPDGAGGTTTPTTVNEFADATGNALAIGAQAAINAV